MTQFSLEFDSPQPVEPPTPAKEEAAPQAPNWDQMARLLAQHADYRVLRRLVPCLDYGPKSHIPETGEDDSRVQHVLVLDTETTGLSHQADKIIELAMLLVAVDSATGLPFGPVDIFEGFEDPGMPIPPVAQEITGISDEMVRGQRLDDATVAAMVARANLIVAHNAGFDRPFVEARFPGFAAKPWACSFADIDWKAAGAGSSKLSALANDQGWFYDAHRAQVDCHALLQVLTQPVGDSGTTGLSQLIHAAAQPSYQVRATGSPFETKDKLKARGYRWDADAKVWSCRVVSEPLLDEELAWLKEAVYGNRRAQAEVEALDGLTRYSLRGGTARVANA
ncbi:3'-5' exonuclease [Hydrogenophaga sp.]|uniref:3'-5' exonuclease n=1 Tax=Hydrogenophaga sp. TaxID=1904254 RepID=UPI0025C5B784|nr:3'-5' exonuclease [Hydrogenophaga sp.]